MATFNFSKPINDLIKQLAVEFAKEEAAIATSLCNSDSEMTVKGLKAYDMKDSFECGWYDGEGENSFSEKLFREFKKIKFDRQVIEQKNGKKKFMITVKQ